MNSDLSQAGGKSSYEPPRLTIISLRPEEAVLGHCKTLNNGGMLGSSCQFIGVQCAQTFGS
jgi:hypothetical protein